MKNSVVFEGSLAGVSRTPFLRYIIKYSVYENCGLKVSLSADLKENCMWLPRLGFEFKTLYQNHEFEYFGMGDSENYVDMCHHTRIGKFNSDAKKEYVNYIMPQEHGNHIKTKELKIRNGLTFLTDSEFEFNVSHYSISSLMKAMHQDELLEDNSTNIRIDYKNSGVGPGSCGPELIDKHKLSEKKIHFEFYIK